MPASATPTPGPVNPGSALMHRLSHGVWLALSTSPIVTTAVCAVVLVAIVSKVRQLRWSVVGRDPLRRFGAAERALIVRRAGGRCEHHGVLLGRCTTTADLEADHVHPHSRGGSTRITNAQSLCRRHNKRKAARIPYGWELRQLERRRRGYFPADMPGRVTRRAQT